jgi:hypothetical protein
MNIIPGAPIEEIGAPGAFQVQDLSFWHSYITIFSLGLFQRARFQLRIVQ